MANEKILVIDDSAQIRDFLARQVLPREGYVCVSAGDGRAGLEVLGKEKPDLILTDMQMPRMSGLEVLTLLAQYKVDIPVVMMTAHGSETIAIEAFRLGVKDYLVKPFTIDEVLLVVGRALTESRLRREKETLARNLAAANQQLERRLQEMAVLGRVGQAVSALLEPSLLMKRIVEAAVFISNGQRGALLLSDSSGLRMSAATGFTDELSGRAVPVTTIAASVLKAVQPVALAAAQLKSEPYGREAPSPQAFLATPISSQGAVLGVLSVDRTVANRPFVAGEGRLLAALADYAAISIQNLRLFDETRSAQGKLEAVINHIADGVIVLNSSGEVLLANPAAQQLLGADLLYNQPLLSSNGAGTLAPLLSRTGAQPRAATYEIAGARGKVLNVATTPVPNLGMVAVLHDITMLKELERIRHEREQSEVEQLRHMYERYVPPAIVEQLMHAGHDALAHPEEREVIVIVASLRGFETLFARLTSEALIEVVLNRYFDALSTVVLKHGGTLDKFMGDAMQAVFGWPIAGADDGQRAINAAIEMDVAFAALHAEWMETLNANLALAIGVGQGRVVAGSIGSAQHQDYTVIGDGVSIAATLNQQAHGGEILMSRSIVDALAEPPEGVGFDEFPPVNVKGVAHEHEIVFVRPGQLQSATRMLPASTGLLPSGT